MWGREMKSIYFSILLAFVFLILTSAVASAGQEIRITSDGERGFCPAIYDNKIIWLSEEYEGTIHMRDLSTGKEIQITVNQSYSFPAIYNDKIVWESGGENIYLYNISTNNKTRLPIPDSRNEGAKDSLVIYGDKIVWRDYGNGENQDIYVYDLSTCNKTRITTNQSTKNPAIYGDKIVWQDYRNGNGAYSDIYMYNLSTSSETRVTTNGSASSPKVYDDRIVYVKNDNIYLYNLSTSMETQITFNGSLKDIYGDRNLAIYSDRIVWQDHRNGNWDIYMYDLSANKETQITADELDESSPAIYGDRIVWQDYRNDRENMYYCSVYMYDFSAKPTMPFASFSTNITSKSGNVPLTVLFTYNSSGGTPTSWYWEFGDGVNSKHAQTATHTFTKLGTYDVSLTVTNAAGSSTLKKSNCITVTLPQAPVADFFSPKVDRAYSHGEPIPTNETVSFIDNSTGSPTSWLWDFGDGTIATTQNPTHIYNEDGGYIVTLTVKNEMGSDTVSKHGYVIVDMGGDIIHPADLSSNVTSGIAPLTVLFHDTTVPNITQDYAYGRDWYFGDGTDSFMDVVHDENGILDENNLSYFYIIHTYKKPGKYTVKLRSYDVAGQSMITKYNYITVTAPETKG